MSFNYTASRNENKKNFPEESSLGFSASSLQLDSAENKKEIFYRGSKLVGTGFYTPEDMLDIHREYERLLRNKNFDKARNFEKEKKYPETWLNSVIWHLMHENGNGLIGVLCDEFEDRGFKKEYFSDINLKIKKNK